LTLAAAMIACLCAVAQAEMPADDLRVYAVNVVKTPPFDKQFIGLGVYLGKGKVLTAAHVVGKWATITHPRVLVAGLDLPAEIVKEGSYETIDLTLLSVDEAELPVSLKLRQNPLCKGPLVAGRNVVIVYPERVVRSRTVSPLLIAPKLRTKFGALIDEPESSGSGVFEVERKCLLGIVSAKVQRYNYRKPKGPVVPADAGYAGIFVPASVIAQFIPPEFRF
jgi:hypothetical protein